MSYTPSYNNTPVLSKTRIGENTYFLKDAEARKNLGDLVNALKDAAYKDVISAVNSLDNAGLPTGSVVKSYVDSQVGTMGNFDVKVVSNLPTASAATMLTLYLTPDASSISGSYIEWITIRSGESPDYTYTWEKIGTTSTDLSDYVQKTTTIAGLNLQSNISANDLSNALNLGAFAYVNQGYGTVASKSITGVSATGTPNGTVSVTLNQTSTNATLTKADYTPAGSIVGSAISNGSVGVTLKNAAAASLATITSSSYTPVGTVSKPSITITSNTDTIQPVTNVGTMASIDVSKFNGGTAASWTGASYNAPSLGSATTSGFAIEGIVASIGTGDASETLIFTAANTSNAVTAQGTFNAGDVNFGTFSGGSAASLGTGFYTAGSAPTLGTAKTFMSSATAALDEAPTFTGNAEANLKVTKVEYLQQTVDNTTFTPVAAELSFSGTTVNNAFVTAVAYDKASVDNATFTGASTNMTVGTITVPSQVITVSVNEPE